MCSRALYVVPDVNTALVFDNWIAVPFLHVAGQSDFSQSKNRRNDISAIYVMRESHVMHKSISIVHYITH